MHGPNQIYRCVQCRTRRADRHLLALHEQQCKRPLCDCGGYHFRHRPGSRLCEHNPMSAVLLASRAGTPDEELPDIAAGVAFHVKGRPSKVCPF